MLEMETYSGSNSFSSYFQIIFDFDQSRINLYLEVFRIDTSNLKYIDDLKEKADLHH